MFFFCFFLYASGACDIRLRWRERYLYSCHVHQSVVATNSHHNAPQQCSTLIYVHPCPLLRGKALRRSGSCSTASSIFVSGGWDNDSACARAFISRRLSAYQQETSTQLLLQSPVQHVKLMSKFHYPLAICECCNGRGNWSATGASSSVPQRR